MSTNERTTGKARIDIGSLLDALDALDIGDEASDSSPLSYRSNGHDGLTDIDSGHELFEAERSEEVEAERSEDVEAEEAERLRGPIFLASLAFLGLGARIHWKPLPKVCTGRGRSLDRGVITNNDIDAPIIDMQRGAAAALL